MTTQDPQVNSFSDATTPKGNIHKFCPSDIESGKTRKLSFVVLPSNPVQNIDSLELIGLWAYLQSLPPTWKIVQSHLMKKFKIGDTKYRRMMAELKKRNLITYERITMPNGTIKEVLTIVLDGTDFVDPENSTSIKSILVDDNPMNTGVSSTSIECLLVAEPLRGKTPPLYNIDMVIKETEEKKERAAANMDLLAPKHNESQVRTQNNIASFSFLISQQAKGINLCGLEVHGFNESQIVQLLMSKIDPKVIQDSITRYAAHLQVTANALRINSKVGLFMRIMKDDGRFDDGKNTPADAQQNEKLDEMKLDIFNKLTDIEKDDIFRKRLHAFYRKTPEENKLDCLNEYVEKLAKVRYSKIQTQDKYNSLGAI